MSSFDKYYWAALEWANAKRLGKGQSPLLSLPRGTSNSHNCPLAKAIGERVTGSEDGYDVQQFVRNFDSGKYPELKEKAAAYA